MPTEYSLTITDDGEWKPIEYDYESPYALQCAYSSTGRARCRVCGDLIPKGVVRLGLPIKWRGGGYGYINVRGCAESGVALSD
jgi:hypothetical protein